MIAILAYAMIITFIVLLTRKKLTVYSALILTPVAFGLVICLLFGYDPLDIFEWIKKGVFYTAMDSDILTHSKKNAENMIHLQTLSK